MTYTVTDIAELGEYHLVHPLRTTTLPTPTSSSSCRSSGCWHHVRSGRR
jgi:hypothetical protein